MSEAKHVVEAARGRIGIKSALMEYACASRGLDVTRIHRRVIVATDRDGSALAFDNMNGPRASVVGRFLCDNKAQARSRLRAAGLTVVDSQVFARDRIADAVDWVRDLDGPAVVKPLSLSRGRGVTTGVTTEAEVIAAAHTALDASRRPGQSVLVERHVQGVDIRVFVVGTDVVSVTFRRRARVRGDGTRTILELIERKNRQRAKNAYLREHPIPTDLAVLDTLTDSGRDLRYVPAEREVVTLRSQSNIYLGGDSIDQTDHIHPEFRRIAVAAVAAIPGVDYAGVDIITPDITAPPDTTNHVIGEIKFSPAPMSHFPYVGTRRDMAGAVLDHELRDGPPSGNSGTAGWPAAVSRAVRHGVRSVRRRPG